MIYPFPSRRTRLPRNSFPRMHHAMCCPPLHTAFWKHALPLEPITCIFNVACLPAPAHDRPERNRSKPRCMPQWQKQLCSRAHHQPPPMQVKNFPVPCTALVTTAPSPFRNRASTAPGCRGYGSEKPPAGLHVTKQFTGLLQERALMEVPSTCVAPSGAYVRTSSTATCSKFKPN
jgi:hypothetical protein